VASLRETNRAGFIAGPPHCVVGSEEVSIARGQGLGNETFVVRKLQCIEVGVAYLPSMDGNLTTVAESNPEAAVRACQKLCKAKHGCAHFTVEFPAKICSLASETSMIVRQLQGHISGPPSCNDQHYRGLEGQDIQEFVERLPRASFELGLDYRSGVATMIFVLCVFLLHLHRTGRCMQLCQTSPDHWSSVSRSALPTSRLPMISPVLPAFVEEYLSNPSSRSLSMAALRPRTGHCDYVAVSSDPGVLQSDDELMAGQSSSHEFDPL